MNVCRVRPTNWMAAEMEPPEMEPPEIEAAKMKPAEMEPPEIEAALYGIINVC